MKQIHPFIRPLQPMEQAFTLSNEAHPLCVVCVLQLEAGPGLQALQTALKALQARHSLLRAGIVKDGGKLYFRELAPSSPIVLEEAFRGDEDSWRPVAEHALNTIFDKRGPLMKCWHLSAEGQPASELIVCFHHAIIDGPSARLILHELLSLAGGLSLAPPRPAPLIPAKKPFLLQLGAYAARQMAEEWRHRSSGLASPIPANSRNAVICLRLSTALSRKLQARVGRKGLNLNSVLLAAMTMALLKHRHRGQQARQARLISFASLRSEDDPGHSGPELGCAVSMMRLCVPLSQGQSAWQLAAGIRSEIFKASRRGDVEIMAWISRYLMRMALSLKNMRLGVTALSFIGKLELEARYGPIQLRDVKAFITNNRFGPEFSAFGKILFGAVGLDFTYLTDEMNEAEARRIVKETEDILEKMAELP